MSAWIAWGGLAAGYLVLAIVVWRFVFRRKRDHQEPIPMPPASSPGVQVATDAILDAAERDEGIIEAA